MKKLTPQDRIFLVKCLTSGITTFRFNSRNYCLHQPNYKLLQRSIELHNNILFDNRFFSYLTEDDIEDILIQQGLWDRCNPIIIDRLSKQLDDYKVDLYKSYCTHPDGIKRNKRLIAQIKNALNQAFSYKHSLHIWTLDSYIDRVVQRFLAMHTLYHNNHKVYNDNADFRHTSSHLLDMAISTKNQYVFNDTILRELARTDPWKTLWGIGKPNPFIFHFMELTEEQRLLLMFSRMYENITNSPNSPPNDVINDDDALDGWLIVQARENEHAKIEKKVQNTLNSKQQRGNELFLPVKDTEEAKQINSLNTTHGKMIKQQREAMIQQKGTVQEREFMDNVLAKEFMTTQKFKNHTKQ